MKPVHLAALSLFFAYISYFLFTPVFAPLIRELKLPEISAGIIMAVSALVVMVASPWWGHWSERVGRRRLMLVGFFGSAVSIGAFAFTAQNGLQNILGGVILFSCLTLARALGGLLFAAIPVATQALIADLTPPETRTKNIALLGAANGLGIIVGPALSGAVANLGVLAPVYLAALIPLVGLVIALLLPAKTKPAQIERVKVSPFDPRIFRLLLIGLGIITIMVAIQITGGFLFQDRLNLDAKDTIQRVSVALTFAGLGMLISQLVLVRLLKLRPLHLVRLGLPLTAICFGGLAIAQDYNIFLGLFLLMGLGMGLVMPGYTSALTLAVNPSEQGGVAGLNSSVQGLAAILGALLGVVLYQQAISLPFIVSAVVCCLLLIMAFFIKSEIPIVQTSDHKQVPQQGGV